ncbi:fimbrial protein [Aeromonas veronii]|uniref:fimbrial protein n=1 Tax=Aeromonas veronii TaxID=654 RepID=UPI001E39283D|nr:hypothetical protein [Aeromonas veronii]MCD6619866.1 hypothetical protein [Aeromonas veronii]
MSKMMTVSPFGLFKVSCSMLNLKWICLLGMSFCMYANGTAVNYTVFTPKHNLVAGSCSGDIGNFLPQSNVKTLIVDNNIPNGTILYSWDYDRLIGRSNFRCSTSVTPPHVNYPEHIDFKFKFYLFKGGYFQTNNPGVGLRLYARPSVVINNTPGALTAPTQVERLLSGDTSIDFSYNTLSVGNGLYGFPDALAVIAVKYRAELVKIGKIDFSSEASSLAQPSYLGDSMLFEYNSPELYEQTEINNSENLLGIKLTQPSCRLSAPVNYNIDLGSFRSGASLPKYGDVKPIVIGLDCNGKPNSVDISFQDGSAFSLSNGSVRLHNTAGSPIDGLEAQMTYNGAPITVDKPTVLPNGRTKISLGSLGQLQSQSVVNATFGVRFVQRAPIVHVGPVKGTVNMFVTYN